MELELLLIVLGVFVAAVIHRMLGVAMIVVGVLLLLIEEDRANALAALVG